MFDFSNLDFARKLSDSNLHASLASIPTIPNVSKSTSASSANLNMRSTALSGMRSAECLTLAPPIRPASLEMPITNPSTPVIPHIQSTSRLRPNTRIDPLPVIVPISAQASIRQPVSSTTVTFASSDNSISYKAHISTSILPPPIHLAALKTNKSIKSESQVSMVRPVINESKRVTYNNGIGDNNGHHPLDPIARKTLPPQTIAVQPRLPTQVPRAAVVFPEQHFKSPPTPDSPVELIPETRDHPAGLDIDEFLPKHLQDTVRLGYVPQPEMSESEAMQAIIRGHKSLVTALSHRRKNIQIVLATWSTKDARLGLEQAIHMDDQSVIVDILNVITLKPYVFVLKRCNLYCMLSLHHIFIISNTAFYHLK